MARRKAILLDEREARILAGMVVAGAPYVCTTLEQREVRDRFLRQTREMESDPVRVVYGRSMSAMQASPASDVAAREDMGGPGVGADGSVRGLPVARKARGPAPSERSYRSKGQQPSRRAAGG